MPISDVTRRELLVAAGLAAVAATAVALPARATYHSVAASVNPCAAKDMCVNPCNPCGAKIPCPCSPCAAKSPCNPCAAKSPCSPCNPCNPCNPCAATNPCNPCAAN